MEKDAFDRGHWRRRIRQLTPLCRENCGKEEEELKLSNFSKKFKVIYNYFKAKEKAIV